MRRRFSAEQAAILVLRALQERGQRRGKELTRARISGSTLRALGDRETITPQWIDELNEWLLSAGWVLVRAGSTYAAIKTSVVENWPRVAAKHLAKELEEAKLDKFDFSSLLPLLNPASAPSAAADRRSSRRRGKDVDGETS